MTRAQAGTGSQRLQQAGIAHSIVARRDELGAWTFQLLISGAETLTGAQLRELIDAAETQGLTLTLRVAELGIV